MQRDKITVFIDLLKAGCTPDAARNIPGRLNRHIWIVSPDLHVEMAGKICYTRADRTQADHAKRFSGQLRTDKLRFPLFNQFGHLVPLPFKRLYPFHRGEYPARGHQKRTDYKLLNRIGVGAGRVKYNDPLLAASVHRDIVDACACARNGGKLGAKLHIVHGGRPDQNAVGRLDMVAADIFAAVKHIHSIGADLIERFNMIHIRRSPFQSAPSAQPVFRRLQPASHCKWRRAYHPRNDGL